MGRATRAVFISLPGFIKGVSAMSLIMQIMVGAVAFVIMVSIYFIITRDELFEGIIDKIGKGIKSRK